MKDSGAHAWVGPFRPTRPTRISLVLALAVMALLNLSLLWGLRGQILGGSNDFMHLYAAGRMTRLGHGGQLFDPRSQYAVQREISEVVRAAGMPYPYLRPPFEALLFVPLSYLPLTAAYLLWTAINLLLIWVFFRLLRSRVPALQRIPQPFWLIAELAFFPVIIVLGQGQDVLLLLLLFTLAFLALSRKREWSAGAWLGLGLFRPQFVLPLVCVLAWSRRWGVVLGVALAALGWGVITATVFGWPMLLDYPRHLFSSEQALNQEGSLLDQMPSIHGLLSVLLRPLPAVVIVTLVAVVSAIVLLWAARFYRLHRAHSLGLAFSAALVASILVSYHAFDHSLSLLLLPLALQLDWLLTSRHRRITAWLLLLPVLPLFLSPVGNLMLRNGGFHLYALALVLWLAALAAAVADTVRARSEQSGQLA